MASINASTSGAGGVITTADNTGILNIQTAGTTAVTVDASQNVGIGTASPAVNLEVSGTGAKEIRVTTNTSGNARIGFNVTGAVYSYWEADRASGAMIYNNGSERMRIDSSGYLSLNRTSALGNAYINIDYSSTGQNAIIIKNTSTTFNGSFIEFRNSAGNTCGNIIQNGTTTVSYSTSSDYRLKENIAPMTGALDTVQSLKPVTYTWKVDGSAGQGFIAHELQAVVPDCVTGEKDAVNEDGSIKAQGVDTSFLVATLTAAIQEQQTIINDLKARIETLEAK